MNNIDLWILFVIAALGLSRIWYERRQERREDEAAAEFRRTRQTYGQSHT